MGAPDFIPDASFKPDSNSPAIPDSSSSAPDFVPDSQFQSDEDKYGGPAGALTAGALHVVNTALPYVGPKIENAIGIPNEEIQGLTREHPVASGVGDVAGFVGGAKTLGALGAPGAIQAAGESIAEPFAAGSLAEKVAHFGTEGALIGGANAANDLALGNPNLTAQKVLSDVGMGFALGSGLGAIAKGAEVMVPKAVEKLGSSLDSLKESALGTAEEPSLFVKAASLPGSVATGQSPNDWAQAFYHGLNAPEANISIRDLGKNLESISNSGKEASDLLRNSIEEETGITETTPEKAEALIRKGPIKNFPPRPGTPLLSSTPLPYEVITEGRPAGSPLYIMRAETAAKDATEAVVDPEKDKAAIDALGLLRDHETAQKNFQTAFMKKGGSGEFAMDPVKVQSFFKKFGDASQELKKQYLNDFINSAQDLSTASENYHGFKEAEDSLTTHISGLAKKNQELAGIAEAMRGRTEGNPSGNLLGDAAMGYAAHAIGVPNPVTAAALGSVEAYRAIKNPFQLGSTLSHTMGRLQVLGDISQTIGNKIGSLAKGIFSADVAGGAGTAGAGLISDKTYAKATNRVQSLMANHSQLMDHLSTNTDGLYEAAPHVTQGIHQTMTAGLQFLNSKVPRPTAQYPLSAPWTPSIAEKADFNRYYKAVDDPLGVLKEVKHGTLSSQSMETLQVVYPELLSEMRKAVVENLNPKKAIKLPYPTRVALSVFLGEPLEESVVPQVMASNQAALSAPPLATQSQAPAKNPRSTLGGLKQLDFSKRANSRGEREE